MQDCKRSSTREAQNKTPSASGAAGGAHAALWRPGSTRSSVISALCISPCTSKALEGPQVETLFGRELGSSLERQRQGARRSGSNGAASRGAGAVASAHHLAFPRRGAPLGPAAACKASEEFDVDVQMIPTAAAWPSAASHFRRHCCRCCRSSCRLLLPLLQVVVSDVGPTVPGVTAANTPRLLLELARAAAGAQRRPPCVEWQPSLSSSGRHVATLPIASSACTKRCQTSTHVLPTQPRPSLFCVCSRFTAARQGGASNSGIWH